MQTDQEPGCEQATGGGGDGTGNEGIETSSSERAAEDFTRPKGDEPVGPPHLYCSRSSRPGRESTARILQIGRIRQAKRVGQGVAQGIAEPSRHLVGGPESQDLDGQSLGVLTADRPDNVCAHQQT